MDRRDIFYCCKTGDISHISYLVEEKDADIHARDKWDGTPLYYACLCGHEDVVLYLLQNGVQCDANTFDGERCLYGALTDSIRHLLRNYKVVTSTLLRLDKYSQFLKKCYGDSEYSDIHFVVENEKILAHRVILASRNSSLQKFLKSVWKNKTSINLSELHTSSVMFMKIMLYLYLGDININKKHLKGFLAVAEHLSMTNLVNEMRRMLLSKNKSSVFHVQLHPLPQQDFMKLFLSSLPKELLVEGEEPEEPLFIDLHIKVQNFTFFCHKVFICKRCSYLKALVTDHFSEASVSAESEIQVIKLSDIDTHVFVPILQFIYTDTAKISPEIVLDVLSFADLYILPGLKNLCASVMQENLNTENIISVAKLIKLYNLSRLEDPCTEFMAKHLEEIIHRPDFQNLILEDANEIKNRQEVDTISVIDDIRYHIDRSEDRSSCFQKYLLINELLQKLQLDA